MNIVDTIFRARKSKNPQRADDPQRIPTMLRGLSQDDTTKDEFNRAFLAGVEPPQEKDTGPRMSNPTAKPSDRVPSERAPGDNAPMQSDRAPVAGERDTAQQAAQQPIASPSAASQGRDGFETSLSRSFQIVEPTEVQGWTDPADGSATRASSQAEDFRSPTVFAEDDPATRSEGTQAEDLSAAFDELDEDEAARLVEAHAADIRLAEAEAGLAVMPSSSEDDADDSAQDLVVLETLDETSAATSEDDVPHEPSYTMISDGQDDPSMEADVDDASTENDYLAGRGDYETDARYEAEPASPGEYGQGIDFGGLRPGSPRLAEFAAFRAITSDMEEKLQAFSETVALSRLTFSSMQPFLEQFEADITVSDEVERERNLLQGEVSDLKRNLEVSQRELSGKLVALAAANDRNSELRIELEQRRQTSQELGAKLDRARSEIDRLTAENANARAEIVKLVAALERETAEKESYYQTRVELTNKLAKLQQSEAQTRNKLLEATLQNDKLTKMQPALVAEQEKLRNELRVAQREKAELQNRLLAAQDQAMQLESEIQALQGHAASEAYAARTELEMHKSALRTSEKALSEADSRQKELQKQLRDSETARQSAENQSASLQAELEGARRERSEAAFKLSDVNLKYMTDLLSLDQQREQNKEFQYNIDSLLADKRRMAKFETLYKAAESQIVSLKEKLALLAENLKDTTDPERLRQSIEIIGELSATQIPANTDNPPKPVETKKPAATH